MSGDFRKYVISVDPGISNIGISLTSYSPSAFYSGDDGDDRGKFDLLWGCHLDLSHSSESKGRRTENRKSEGVSEKYVKFSDQKERLSEFLSTNPNLSEALKLPNLVACVEQQEGVTNSNLLYSLMRVNYFSGYVCGYLESKGVKCVILPKNYKRAGGFCRALFKKRNSQNPAKNRAELVKIRKGRRRRRKAPEVKDTSSAFGKKFNCALVRAAFCVVDDNSPSSFFEKRKKMSEEEKRRKTVGEELLKMPDSKFNHVADSISCAMRYAREIEKERRTKSRKNSSKGKIKKQKGVDGVNESYGKVIEMFLDY